MGAKHLMVLQHRIGLPIASPHIYIYALYPFYTFFCAVLTGNVSYWFLMRLSCAGKCLPKRKGVVCVCVFLMGSSITMMGYKKPEEVSGAALCKYANYT